MFIAISMQYGCVMWNVLLHEFLVHIRLVRTCKVLFIDHPSIRFEEFSLVERKNPFQMYYLFKEKSLESYYFSLFFENKIESLGVFLKSYLFFPYFFFDLQV